LSLSPDGCGRVGSIGEGDQKRRRFGNGFIRNAIEANSIEERVTAIEAETGPIEVVVYNLGAQIGDRPLKDTSLKAFETGWRIGTFGLFRLRRPCAR
jgi:NAD(P)-dependent dehydrogenase (short-subunit alcohol dehydrogenase family)